MSLPALCISSVTRIHGHSPDDGDHPRTRGVTPTLTSGSLSPVTQSWWQVFLLRWVLVGVARPSTVETPRG